ncbi:MAG: YjgN family protein [candidate division NC10 bacterium]|nr:YjgN family protein [candidate division NC10 bacterium]
MATGVKCPKCGLMQLPGPTCKSCRTPLGASSAAFSAERKPPVERKTPGNDPSPQAGQAHRMSFHGTGGSLFGIHIVNLFLTVVTLGLYYFWGKAKVRSYLLSQTELEGDRFAYHGTGKELLFGSLKAVLLVGLPLMVLNLVMGILVTSPIIEAIVKFLSSVLILAFLPVAIVGARRYRLSRTSWRGVRFSFRGGVREFVTLFLWGSLLSTVTLGLYYPIFDARRHGFLVSHSYLGNQPFSFDGRGKDLFGRYLLTLLLTLPTLGLCWVWFAARKQRYYWDHTAFGPARFHSTVTGGRLLGFSLGNMLLLIVTLGLGWPWVAARGIRFTFRYLTLEGSLDLASIQQEAQDASATGEGLANLLDAGFDLGI